MLFKSLRACALCEFQSSSRSDLQKAARKSRIIYSVEVVFVRKDLAGGYPRALDSGVLSLPPLPLELARQACEYFPQLHPFPSFPSLFFTEPKASGCFILELKTCTTTTTTLWMHLFVSFLHETVWTNEYIGYEINTKWRQMITWVLLSWLVFGRGLSWFILSRQPTGRQKSTAAKWSSADDTIGRVTCGMRKGILRGPIKQSSGVYFSPKEFQLKLTVSNDRCLMMMQLIVAPQPTRTLPNLFLTKC